MFYVHQFMWVFIYFRTLHKSPGFVAVRRTRSLLTMQLCV